ncbi:alanine racemase [Halovivax asiaticus JCM 14624]|uniref:Alanine racemase n=1 Tax=Halovivax asiaticus JCM 14624 TaxID=1227490 RepID=M0BRE0_9EURY|nr:alanine racemase [Halovivax asiaticus]ELZ12269.1 alanine racemase [Halovivax asiaticus JCM 14624]
MSSTYDAYRSALSEESYPLAYLDRSALEANIRTTRRRASGRPVRVASKSIRCRAVLREVLDRDGFRGVMCYTGHEAAHLAADGFDDLLVAYPVVDADELAAVCSAIEAGTRIVLLVDSDAHVERISEVAAERGVSVPICLDLDVSTDHLGVYFGVRRSGIRSASAALELARTIADAPAVTLSGLMGYEGQLAGLPDDDPSNSFVTNAVVRRLKRRSEPIVHERRQETVAALEREGFALDFVNGGGTGCLESTRRDTSVTELTAGSAFFAPGLFDHYRGFTIAPAAGYAIEVVRRPEPGVYTCRGGGYVASGPPGVDKIPTPHLPRGVSLFDAEGAGEVQTPVSYDGPHRLELGDPVFCRHAKAGELCTHFEHLHVIDDGELVDRHPTYRGDGAWFL